MHVTQAAWPGIFCLFLCLGLIVLGNNSTSSHQPQAASKQQKNGSGGSQPLAPQMSFWVHADACRSSPRVSLSLALSGRQQQGRANRAGMQQQGGLAA